MPANNSTARPKNRDQKTATQLLKDIKTLKAKLRKQLGKGEITQTAFDRTMKKLDPAFKASVINKVITSVSVWDLNFKPLSSNSFFSSSEFSIIPL